VNKMKLGFMERKTVAPKSPQELMTLLSEVMSAALNNEVDLENAKVALNASTRLVEVWQADSRMKALALASGRNIVKVDGWQTIETEKLVESK
jgi:hypothetical protein